LCSNSNSTQSGQEEFKKMHNCKFRNYLFVVLVSGRVGDYNVHTAEEISS
jgi:hypothetical protein